MKKDLDDTESLPEINFPLPENHSLSKEALMRKSKDLYIMATIGLFTLFTLSIMIFPYQGMTPELQPGNERQVLLDTEDYRTITNNYNNSTEQGYCIFGYVNHNSYEVEKVVHVEKPFYSSYTNIKNYCVDEIRAELPSLLLDPSYRFLGKVHSHPRIGTTELSDRDIHSMGVESWYIRLKAVVKENRVRFYSSNNLGQGLEVKYSN